MTKGNSGKGKSRTGAFGREEARKSAEAWAALRAEWKPANEADTPKCWACGGPMILAVAGPSGDKIHPGCYTLASDKHRAELQRKAIADTPPVGMYISKRPPQLTSYDWEVKGEDEDNGPAVQHHDML